jgi:hypothetical protein
LTIRTGSAGAWSHEREALQNEVMEWSAQVISRPFEEPTWDV